MTGDSESADWLSHQTADSDEISENEREPTNWMPLELSKVTEWLQGVAALPGFNGNLAGHRAFREPYQKSTKVEP